MQAKGGVHLGFEKPSFLALKLKKKKLSPWEPKLPRGQHTIKTPVRRQRSRASSALQTYGATFVALEGASYGPVPDRP